ncbi:hypothetical protein UK23_23855 [Lentzea aerocolonigenes]|uniref:Uncharacterized protein n=1 Tax=Lentzea aerocolonigenes TaxID=68170 RepID=A0A0F0GY31_LENAE|nr:hypothetical protein [Lentzea aerocolonigenes]KJK46353.1 hypothetical protein UK23_23855 [Lentzea aerocolonigenes]
MIHAGREAVDTAGIARLHGLSTDQARRVRPWAQPGHPDKITSGGRGKGQPDLWDLAQARAYATGQPVPDLPAGAALGSPGDPDDLFDRNECAAFAEIETKTWTDYKVPGSVDICGRLHWSRRVVESFKAEREERAQTHRPGGRPPGRTESKPRAEIAREIRELVASGETNVAEIARRVGVAYSTAMSHVKTVTQEQR